MFLCDHLINIASDRLEQRGALLHECLCALRQVIYSPHGAEWYESSGLVIAYRQRGPGQRLSGASHLEFEH